MSEIEVQLLEEKYLDGYHTVRSLTYNSGNPIPPERQWTGKPGAFSMVAISNGQVSGSATVLELTATRGEAVLKCGGVCGVAVLPEMRKSGVGSAMMTWLVRHLRETGTPLASLYAFREPYYRKFGYELTGSPFKITCPTHRWPKTTCTLPIQRLGPTDWRQLVDCYTKFAHSRSGLNIRSESEWQRVLGENRPLTIYAIGEPVEAYAVVSHVTTFWTTDHISEVAWSSRSGYDGLLSMLGGLAINKSGLSWREPSDGIFFGEYMDEGIEVKLERPIMFRVTDVPAALRLLKPHSPETGEFVLQIHDAIVPENEGPWKVSFGGGHVTVELAANGESPDLTMDIKKFAQAFMGEPSLTQLAASESIQYESLEGFAAATRLMPAQATYCMDFF